MTQAQTREYSEILFLEHAEIIGRQYGLNGRDYLSVVVQYFSVDGNGPWEMGFLLKESIEHTPGSVMSAKIRLYDPLECKLRDDAVLCRFVNNRWERGSA